MNPISGVQMYTFHNCQLAESMGVIDQEDSAKCGYLKCLISVYLERLSIYLHGYTDKF